MNESKLKALNKYINQILKPIYPMVEKFELVSFEIIDLYILKIILNDDTISEENMYQKGLDPHYVIEHIKNFLKYFSNEESFEVNLVVFSPSMVPVYRSTIWEKF